MSLIRLAHFLFRYFYNTGGSTMQQGVLYFDRQTERMDIRFENKEIYGGLHCGTAMEVLINDEWVPTRIEYGNDWYLVGVQKESLPGLQVRI